MTDTLMGEPTTGTEYENEIRFPLQEWVEHAPRRNHVV